MPHYCSHHLGAERARGGMCLSPRTRAFASYININVYINIETYIVLPLPHNRFKITSSAPGHCSRRRLILRPCSTRASLPSCCRHITVTICAPGHCSRRERGKKSRIASERPHSPSQGERGTLPSASYSSREHAAHTPSLPPRLLGPASSHTAENATSQHIRSAQTLHAIVTTPSLCLFRMSVCELRACVRMYFPLLCWTTTADAENVLPVGGSVPGGELHAFLLLSNGGTLLRVFCT